MPFEFCWNAGQPHGRAAGSDMAGQGRAGQGVWIKSKEAQSVRESTLTEELEENEKLS